MSDPLDSAFRMERIYSQKSSRLGVEVGTCLFRHRIEQKANENISSREAGRKKNNEPLRKRL